MKIILTLLAERNSRPHWVYGSIYQIHLHIWTVTFFLKLVKSHTVVSDLWARSKKALILIHWVSFSTPISLTAFGSTGVSFLSAFFCAEPWVFLADTPALVWLSPRQPAKRRLKHPFDTNNPSDRGGPKGPAAHLADILLQHGHTGHLCVFIVHTKGTWHHCPWRVLSLWCEMWATVCLSVYEW